MAKKKVSNAQNDKPSQKQDVAKPHQETAPSLMDSEKLERLKSLNQKLLMEAVERRQQVDSLVQSKGTVEMELTRSNTEREALESELARVVEREAELEVERRVLAVYVGAQVGVRGEELGRKMKGLEVEMRKWKRESEEKGSEIVDLNGSLREIEGALGNEREVTRRVRFERDDFEDKLNRQIQEDEGLRANLTELHGKVKQIERETEELRTAYNAVVREKKDMEMRIQSLMGEKDLSERGLFELNKLIEKMKDEMSDIVTLKERVEKENNEEMIKRRELENVVNGLNERVRNLQKEEVKLQTIVSELEKKCTEGEEKLKGTGREIDCFVEEKKLSEKRIQSLVEEKSLIEKDLSEALKQLAENKFEIENLSNEKIDILDAKNQVDGEVGELRNHVDELKATVFNLKEFNLADVEKISSLESEVGDYKCKLENGYAEREVLKSSLNEEKQNALKLKEKIQELEMQLSKSHSSAGKLKSENAAILTEKVGLEKRCNVQGKEISSLKDTVVKVREEYDLVKTKVDLADANSEVVLNMLKGVSAFCSKDEQEGEDHDLLVNGEEVKLHAVELEKIKNAFKRKSGKVEEMKKQLEFLQSSVVDAQKKKGFLTMFSSAVTLVGAASVAYFASAH